MDRPAVTEPAPAEKFKLVTRAQPGELVGKDALVEQRFYSIPKSYVPDWMEEGARVAVAAIMSLPPEIKMGLLRWLRDACGAPITVHDGERGNSGMRNQ